MCSLTACVDTGPRRDTLDEDEDEEELEEIVVDDDSGDDAEV
jgi:hypothetical protein